MSKEVDERVVEMRFDNAQFEKGVQTSMSTIEKLKKGLKFDGATKGLENVETAVKRVNVNPLASAVQSLGQKFSALEVMGVTALANITNSAVNAGKKMLAALTIDPVKTGFQEYETQINSIQTILANTSHAGTTLEEVNSALDQLNKYADMTIYNFTQMTKNIGTFTAAGVDLKTSVSAIKGIANLAAVSGSTAQQASTAMYQLSQAIASGKVNLQDWNSVVNAGMGGKVFQDALKNTAKAMGVVIDESISFRESISAKDGSEWLTADILLKTLQQFTGDMTDAELAAIGFKDSQIAAIQAMAVTANEAATKVKTFSQLWDTLQEAAQSGWTQTWELVIGDFDQAKSLLTEISDAVSGIINESAESRNSLLEGALTGSASKWEDLTSKINEAGISTDQFEKRLREVVLASGVTEDELDDLISKNGSLSAVFQKGLLPIKLVVTAIKSFAEEVTTVTKPVQVATTNLEKFNEVVRKVIRGDFGNGAERIDALTKAGYDNVAVQKLVNMVWERNGHNWSNVTVTAEELSKVIGELSTEEIQSVGYTEEQANALKELAEQAEKTGTPLNELIESFNRPSGRDLIIDSFRTVLTSLYKVIMSVKDAWTNIFPPMTSKQLYGIIEAVHTFTQGLAVNEDTLDKLTRTFQGLFAILDLISTFLGGGFRLAIQAINFVLGLFGTSILDLSAKLGDAAVSFRNFVKDNEFIKKFFQGIVAAIPQAITMVKNWISAISQLPVVTNIVDKVKGSLGGLREAAINVIEGLQNGLRTGLTIIPQTIRDIAISILETFKKVLDINSPAKEPEKLGVFTIEGFVEGLIEASKMVVTVVGNIAKTVLTTFMDILGNIDWGAVIAVGMGIGLLVVANKLADAIDKLATPLKAFEDLVDDFGNLVNAKVAQIKVANLKIFAEAVAVLAGAVAVLAILPWDNVWKSGIIIAGLAGVLAGIFIILEKFGPKEIVKFQSSSLGLLGIAGSLLLVATAFGKVTKAAESENLAAGIGIFAGLILGLIGLVAAFTKLEKVGSGDSIGKFAILMAKLSGAIFAMVLVVKLISFLKPEEIEKGALFVAGFGVFLAGFTLIGKFKTNSLTKVTNMMTKLGLAVAGMALAVKLIGKLDDNDLQKGTDFVKGFMVIVLGMQAIGMLPSKGFENLGKTLLSIAAAIGILTLSVKTLAGIDGGSITKGIVAIGFIALIVEALAKSVATLQKDAPKIGASLLALSASIGILAGIAALIGGIELAKLAKGTAVVYILGSMMTGFAKSLRATRDVHKNITAMSISIGVLAASVAVLSFLDPASLIAPTIAMGTLLGMFALVVASSKNIQGSLGPLIVMTTALGLMATALYLLNGLDIENMLGTATALSELLLALSISFAIITKTGGLKKEDLSQAMITLAGVTGALAAIAGILILLSAMDVEPSMESALSLSLLLVTLTGVTAAMTLLGKAGGVASAANGVLGFIVVVGLIGALMAALGGLLEWQPDLEQFLDKGIVVLQKIGEGIGSFVGGIVSSFMGTAFNSLPLVASMLSSFMDNLNPFISAAKSIDSSAMGGIDSLVKMILALTAADLVNGLMSFFGLGEATSLSSFAEQLVPFGEAMAEFGEVIKGKIDPATTEAAASAGMMLAELNKSLPKEGGLLQDFLGTSMGLDTFGTSIKTFGEAIVEFSDVVAPNGQSKINQDAVEAAANAGKTMAGLVESLPREGGVLQDFFGSQDLSSFSEQLVGFGEAIVDFSETVAPGGMLKVNQEAVDAAANAGLMLTKLYSSLPAQGGKLQEFLGEQSLTDFSDEIGGFATAIVDFSDKVAPEGTSAINQDAVEAATNAGLLLAGLYDALPKEGGVVQWFTGSVDMESFGKSLVTFGTYLSLYSDFAALVKPVAVSASATAALDLVTLVKSLDENESIFKGWFSKETNLTDFFDGLVAFGTNLAVYSDFAKLVDPSAVTKSAEAAEGIVTLVNSLGDKGVFDTKLSLGDIAADLIPFGENLAIYSDFVGLIDPDAVYASVTASRYIINLLEAIANANLAGGDRTTLSSLGGSLSAYGENLKAYSDAVQGVDEIAIEASSIATESLVKIANTFQGDGGAFSSNETALEQLAKGLIPLGESLAIYSDFAALVKPSSIDASLVAAKSLSSLMDTLGESTLAGNKAILDDFGSSLMDFGRRLSVYSDFVVDIKPSSISDSVTAVKDIIDAFSLGGGKILIDKESLSGFGTSIISFGESLATYSSYAEQVLPVTVTAATTAAESLVGMSKNLGDKSLYGEQGSLTAFGVSLKMFGESFELFSDDMTRVDIEAVNNAITLIEDLIEISSTLGEDNVLSDLFSKKESFADFGASLASFGENVGSFYKSTKDIKNSTLEGVIENVNSLAAMGKDLEGIDFSGFTELTNKLSEVAINGVDYFVKAFDNAHDEVKTSVNAFIKAAADSINSKDNTVFSESLDLMVQNGLTAMNRKEGDFKRSGELLINAFKNGVENKKTEAKNSIKALAKDVIDTIHTEFGISGGSSSVFKEIGGYVCSSLAAGIDEKANVVRNSANKVASTIEETIRDTTGIHSISWDVLAPIGEYVPPSVAAGMEKTIGVLKNTTTSIAQNGLIDTLENILLGGTGEDIGDAMMIDVSQGIKSNMSAEEVAEKKAQNIANAFKTALEELDLAASIRDLEFSLSAEDAKSDFDAYQKELAYMEQKQADQVIRVSLAQAKYEKMVETFGETSKNALEAYKELLEQQVELSNQEKEIAQLTTDYEADQLQKRKDLVDQKSSIFELEYELTKSQNERTASQGQKVMAEVEHMREQQRQLQEELKEAEATYGALVQQYGSGAAETYEAYASVLQLRIDYTNLGNDITKAMEDEMERNTQAFEKYKEYLKENKGKLRAKGWTTEEIEAEAMKESGYDPTSLIKKMDKDARQATVAAMKNVQTTYKANATSTFEPLITEFDGYGQKYATAVGTGLSAKAPTVVDTAKQMITDSETEMKAQYDNWTKVGTYLVEGFVKGIKDNISRAANAAAEMAREAYEAAMEELEMNSPSKKFMRVGMYVDLGFAKGVRDYAGEATSATSDMAIDTVDAMSQVISQISDMIDSDMDVEPTIRPVLDLSEVKTGAKSLNSMFNYGQALTIGASLSKAKMPDGQNGAEQTTPTSVQFVQNNYSPKALSRIDIYRDTKNQVASLERLMKR